MCDGGSHARTPAYFQAAASGDADRPVGKVHGHSTSLKWNRDLLNCAPRPQAGKQITDIRTTFTPTNYPFGGESPDFQIIRDLPRTCPSESGQFAAVSHSTDRFHLDVHRDRHGLPSVVVVNGARFAGLPRSRTASRSDWTASGSESLPCKNSPVCGLPLRETHTRRAAAMRD